MRPADRAVVVVVVALLSPAPSAARAEEGGLSLGSKKGEVLEAHVGLTLANLKATSDFAFGTRGDGRRAPRYVQDLDFPEDYVPLGVAAASVKLGLGGWLGAEVVGTRIADQVGQIRGPRRIDGFELAQGDIVESDASFLFVRAHYGWEVRWRFFPGEGVPLDVALSPTLGLGVYDLDVRVRRLLLTPSPRLGGHMTALVIAPGLRIQVELLDAIRIGADLEVLPGVRGELSPFDPEMLEWERARVWLAARVLDVLEASVGYRYLNTSARGRDESSDVKLQGVDFLIGVRF